MAFLAALPKAPNNYNPLNKYDAAISRRNWVIDKMYENNFINSNELSYKNAFQLFHITDKLNSSFKRTSGLYRMLSNTGLNIVEKNTLLKKQITKYAMGI